MKKIPQDIIGDIAVLKFPRHTWKIIKILKARKFLKQNKHIKTVLEKTEGFSGPLRIPTTKHLAGIKTKTAHYKENNATFSFDIDQTYFSPRLSNERKVIAEEVSKLLPKNKSKKILIMFAGVGPYPIAIAKKLKQEKKSAIIYANELNKDAIKFLEENIRTNKVQDYIKIIPCDAKKLPDIIKRQREFEVNKSAKSSTSPNSGLEEISQRFQDGKLQTPEKFDIVLMPRPNLKETFLTSALKLSKKGTTIFYHGFGKKEDVIKEIKKDCGNKIENISIRKAGDIGIEKWRWQAVFKVR